MQPRIVSALLIAGLLFGGASTALAGSLRRDVLSALKEKNLRESAIALEKRLSGEDSAAAADLLIKQILRKERPETIHEVALNALAAMVSDEALARLIEEVKQGPLEVRLRAIEALGRNEGSKAHWAVLGLLQDPVAQIRTAAGSALSYSVRTSDRETFEAMLGDPAWTVRSVAAGALYQLSGPEPVPALAKALAAAEGRLVDDLTDALESVSGQSLGPYPHRYLDWWAKKTGKTGEKTKWVPPRPSFRSPIFRTRSRRILFVLSVGETMKQAHGRSPPSDRLLGEIASVGKDLAKDLKAAKTKLDVAKVHLRTMIRSLEDDVKFDVLVYAASPSFAFGSLTAADARSRKRGEGRIQGLSPSTGANLHGALIKCFDPRSKAPFTAEGGPDTIVLLSDGGLGKPGSEDRLEVGLTIYRWNQVRQIRFLVAAVGQAEVGFLGGLGGVIPRGSLVTIP